MSKIFESLAIIGDAVSEEDRVVHLLASCLLELYSVLVTALEAHSKNIPKWELLLRGCFTKSQSSTKRYQHL